MPFNAQIDAPLTLSGLFPPDSSDEEDNHEDNDDGDGCLYEIQTMNLVGKDLQVRQYDYHSHNANQVWPGTFNLAEYLLMPQRQQQDWGHILELGSATGILAIRLAFACRLIQHGTAERNIINIDDEDDTAAGAAEYCCCSSITTSDVCDEGNQIEHNVRYNVNLNRRVILGDNDSSDNVDNIDPGPIDIPHIPHTWGTGWKASVMKRQQKLHEEGLEMDKDQSSSISSSSSSSLPSSSLYTAEFDTIVASDILLYVSAYPALVETLQELMPVIVHHDVNNEEDVDEDGVLSNKVHTGATSFNKKKKMKICFVMSWNRRMKESAEFFQLMTAGGFDCQHEGKCIYTFTRTRPKHVQ
jgi:Lysine methyltransferase